MKKYLLAIVLAYGCEPTQSKAAAKGNFHIEEDSECGQYWQHCAVLHDDKRHMTCWSLWQSNGDAMQCFPDWAIEKPKEY